jgi:hypothetical protein
MRNREGFALITVILASATITVLLAAMFTTTRGELSSVRSNSDGASGFYSAEAGLNLRGDAIRSIFQGYIRPSGVSPDPALGCVSGNLGSGHFQCVDYSLNRRTVSTYVIEDPRNNDPNDVERMITIPPGERFAGLNAIQYRYSVFSEAVPTWDARPEAILEMVFRTRLVPLFQFAAFYNKDLEILPGPNMTLGGPVHVNGDLYVNANNGSTLSMDGQITVSLNELGTAGGGFWRGRKNTDECTGTVRVDDASAATNPNPEIPCNGAGRRQALQPELDAWNGRIDTGLDALTVPPIDEFDPGGMYWREADLVVALDLTAGLANARVIVPNRVGGGENVLLTNIINDPAVCPGLAARSYERSTTHAPTVNLAALPNPQRAVEWSNSFRDRRENTDAAQLTARRLMLEVDVRALMDCMHRDTRLFQDGPSVEDRLDDTSGGGLVWYFTVFGPNSGAASSGYGVRLRNGDELRSTIGLAPEILGLTVVSDQAIFIEGHYNRGAGFAWKPASFLSDAINILSRDYNFGAHLGGVTAVNNPMTVMAAFLSGTRTTGNINGTGGQGGAYNGGLENYPIFHENWSGDVFTYRGSFVSLEEPRHSTGMWSGAYYSPPTRDWGYDSRFNNVANLPPLSPRFVYLLQERFVRDFTR